METSKGEIARRRIVEAANGLIYHKGYNMTSLADVASIISITKGNLHYHFKSKEELLEAVIDFRLQSIGEQLEQWELELDSPHARIKRFVQMLLNEEEHLVRYGCPMGSLNVELGKTQESLKSKSLTMFDRYLDWLDKQFKLIDSRNAKSLSRHLMTMAQGAALMAYIYHDTQWLKRECKHIIDWLDGL